MQAWRDGSRNKRCVIGSLARIMRERTVSMDVMRGLRNSILLPLMYGSETRHGIGHSSQESMLWKQVI